MQKGAKILLKMMKNLCMGKDVDNECHVGKVLFFDAQKERIFFKIETSDLEDISLDGLYQCEIHTELESYSCTGTIEERSISKVFSKTASSSLLKHAAGFLPPCSSR